MNRGQAEHILTAYVTMTRIHEDECSDALKQVILDAMTDDKKVPDWMPGITYPSYTPFTNPTVTQPWTEPYKPIVTCGNDVTKVVEQ